MKHEPIPVPPEADDSPGSGPRWTNRKMVDFLRALATTHSVGDAAKAVGMSRQSAYKLRTRTKGRAFDLAWDRAFCYSYGNLPYAALERALNGTEVIHFYKGQQIGTTRRYDERLTVALLKLMNSPQGLAVVSSPGMATRSARRFEALLEAIATHGEDAIDPREEDAYGAFFADDSADLSPLSDAQAMAEFRRSLRKPRR
jgi:hypothetical protein